MTEIPEHLLARSKARRQAIGQDEGTSEAPAAESSSTAVEAVAGGATAPAAAEGTPAPVPSKAPGPPAPPPAPPKRPEVIAAETRRKIPWWAVPAVAGLPVWAAIYAFTLEPPSHASLVESEGAELYATCAGCHGATGGGGVGPAFEGGAVIETFSNFQDHIDWVVLGSEGWQAERGNTYGDTDKPVLGFSGSPMPPFGGSMSPEEIALVVRYEREVLAGHECEPELAELTGEACE